MKKITTFAAATALLAASTLSLQAQEVYSTNFSVGYASSTDATSFDGTTIAPESWFGSVNNVGVASDVLSLNNTSSNRFRGSGVWLDTSTWGAAATVTVSFEVTNFTAGTDSAAIFQVYAANGVDASNIASLDLHGAESLSTTADASTGTASIGQIGSNQTITGSTNATPSIESVTFAYNGTDQYIALVFANLNGATGTGNTLTIDNLTVSVPEPGTYALLAGLTGLAFVMLRRRQA